MGQLKSLNSGPILKELETGVALTKEAMVNRLRGRGYEINPNSIGSMLSVLRGSQVLEVDKNKAYRLKK